MYQNDDSDVTTTAVSDADLAAMTSDLADGVRCEAEITDADLIAMERQMHAENPDHANCGWMSDAELDHAMLRYPEGYGINLAVEYHANSDNPYHPYLHDYKSVDSRVYLGQFATHAAAVAAGVKAARKMVVDKLRAVRSVNPNDVPVSARTLRARQPWRYDAAGKGRAA